VHVLPVETRKSGLWMYYSLAPAKSEFHRELLDCLMSEHFVGVTGTFDCVGHPKRVRHVSCTQQGIGMLHKTQGLRRVMRKGLLLAMVLAIVAMPMAFAGAGFCRSMPCCPPHMPAHATSVHQPDCCNTTNCDEAPAAASDYTTAKQLQRHDIVSTLAPVAIIPVSVVVEKPHTTRDLSPPIARATLQRRIAILSVFLI